MLHSKHITLTADKDQSEATLTQFKVNQGVIARVWVHFPPGCAGLVKLRIYHEGHPFLPVESDAHIQGDSYTYEYPIMFEIKQPPELITIEAWNEDEVYDHSIDVQFLIIPKEWILPVGAYEGIVAALKAVVLRRIE